MSDENKAINYDEAKVPSYVLPDPLVAGDGSSVQDAAAWRRRRLEILQLFERSVYGQAPSLPVEATVSTRSVEAQALGGRATRKQLRVSFAGPAGEARMELLIYLPNDRPTPVPVVLGLNFGGNHTVHPDPDILLPTLWDFGGRAVGVVERQAAESERGVDAGSWPVEMILARGYGLATVYYGDLDPDFDDGFHNGVHALFAGPSALRECDAWGAVSAWSWGLSRALDVLQADPDIAADRIALAGHSRLGKAALWAGAQDERFSLVISNNSGCGGAALSRRRFGETVAVITTAFPHWFCENFKDYGGREDDLPVDQHQLISLIAPRPVYVASAEDDLWADPRGEFLSAQAASPVYLLCGREGLAATEMPAVNQPVMSTIGYHVRSGNHGITPQDWGYYLDFADLRL
jgi:hypothetical protein